MNVLTQHYQREIGRCSRLINIMSFENLNEVCFIINEYLERLETLKNRMMKMKSHEPGLDLELFDTNMRACRVLLEYADVFILHDIDKYQQSILCLLDNFRSCIKRTNANGLLMSTC